MKRGIQSVWIGGGVDSRVGLPDPATVAFPEEPQPAQDPNLPPGVSQGPIEASKGPACGKCGEPMSGDVCQRCCPGARAAAIGGVNGVGPGHVHGGPPPWMVGRELDEKKP